MKSICEYKLIQQTPMIHFQSREPGACLRPSEIKSKLDKFILNQEKDNILDSWYIDRQQSQAFKYKVKIYTDENVGVERPHRELCFVKEQRTVMYHNPITLKIICFDNSLMQIICKHIEAFFLFHNFGTRQNKGFGSFVLQRSIENKTSLDNIFSQYKSVSCDVYKVAYNDGTAVETIFSDVATFSNVLKSGINRGNIRSYLVEYCLGRYGGRIHDGRRIGGDKYWLKCEAKLAPIVARKTTPKPDHEEVAYYRYNRAMFGAASNLKFIQLDENDRPDWNSATTILVKSVDAEVKRIPSPVLYKVIGNTLYMIVRAHSDAVYGKTFAFSIKEDENQTSDTAEDKIIENKLLETPQKSDVNPQKVFKSYVKDINNFRNYYYKKLSNRLEFLRQNKQIDTL